MCSRTPLSLVGARPRGRTRTGVGVSCSPAVSDGTCEAACACRVMRARHSSANSEVVSCTAPQQLEQQRQQEWLSAFDRKWGFQRLDRAAAFTRRRGFKAQRRWRFFLKWQLIRPDLRQYGKTDRNTRNTPRPRPKKIAYFGPYSTPEKYGKNVFNSPV